MFKRYRPFVSARINMIAIFSFSLYVTEKIQVKFQRKTRLRHESFFWQDSLPSGGIVGTETVKLDAIKQDHDWRN